MAIELCEFLSDIMHPENCELVSSTVSQLVKERRQARLECKRRVFEENQLRMKQYSVEIENYSSLK